MEAVAHIFIELYMAFMGRSAWRVTRSFVAFMDLLSASIWCAPMWGFPVAFIMP